MDSDVFNIIIITLVVVVLLHIIYNNKNKVDKENMEIIEDNDYTEASYREEGTSGLDRTADKNNWFHVVNKIALNDNTAKKHKKTKQLIFDDFYKGQLLPDDDDTDYDYDNDDKYKEVIRKNANNNMYMDVYGNDTTINNSDLDIKDYIKKYVLNGNNECGCVVDRSKALFTRNEVDEYREQSLRFHDKINGSSAPAEDPVDKFNIISLNEGIKANGQTVADFYDNIVNTSY